MSWNDPRCDVSELTGKVLSKVDVSNDEITFVTEDGDEYLMYHAQDCCECVSIDDICGDVKDLVGSVITNSEEVSGCTPPTRNNDYPAESETWTFYKIDTAKGGVMIRWYGTSNGCYSESVDFCKKGNK